MNRGSTKARRFLLSTATAGKENTDAFLDILEGCEPGEPLYLDGWRKYEWDASETPHLQTVNAQMDAKSAKHFLSEDMYNTQYEGGLPKKAGRIFPRTFIREAFIAPDPNKAGYLLDGSPYNTDKLEFQGDSGGGIDWGFDHDTVITEGYRGLDQKIHLLKQIVGNGSSPSDWANQVEEDALKYNIQDWFADGAGAFQNQEIRNRGLRVVPRAFQEKARGKEWMIGIAYYWLSRKMVVIPDTQPFQKLKGQLLKWTRDGDGKPKKGDDDCNDSFIIWISKWDPRYYESSPQAKQPDVEPVETDTANNWEKFSSAEQSWLPESWKNREELRREPWDK